MNFFDHMVKDIGGKDFALREFKGKAVLVVNTASKCGYTPQYKGLQELFDKYKVKGFVVLGFPSNDFGKQEPAPDAEIEQFCELNYGVNFPLFSKGPVSGTGIQPVFKTLTEGTGDIKWNFEKFLVDRNGKLVKRFASDVEPADLAKEIEGIL